MSDHLCLSRAEYRRRLRRAVDWHQAEIGRLAGVALQHTIHIKNLTNELFQLEGFGAADGSGLLPRRPPNFDGPGGAA